MANKYSSALEKAQKMVEEQSKKVQQNAGNLAHYNYASAFQKVGILNEPQTISPGFMTPDQAPAVSSLIPQATSNPTLNSFLIADQNRKQREQQEAEEAARQQRQQAISQAMNEGFLSKVKGNQPTDVTGIPSTPAVSDPLQKILDLVSGNTANAGTRNPALPEVTVNNGVAADDWRRGIRQYTDANGNIIRDENGNAYPVNKLYNDGRNYSTINQTDNDPMRNSRIDKILDSLDYIRAKGANALEGAYQNFRAVDAGLSNAASAIGGVFKANAGTASNGLKTPNLNPFAYTNNRPVIQNSTNSNGRIKSQEELSETAGASNLRGKANEAYTKALEDSARADVAGKQLAEIEKKHGAVSSNPVTRVMADLGAAIDGQIPYVALNMIPGIGTALSASARAALSSVDAYKEARNEGATRTQARAYSGREAINQGVGDLLIGGIAGRGQGALGKIMANTKAGRALARAYGTHITSPMLKTGIKYFGTILGEGGEEALQKLIEVGNKRATYDPNAKVTGAELAYEGILGGLTAGVFNAVDVPANYRAYKSDFDTVNELSKAAAAVTSFEEARYVTLQCDILLDECNIALGETAAPVNETDFDTRARYEYIKNGVERVKASLQTDSQAIIDSNTRFDEDVSFTADAPADNIVNEVANIVVDVAENLDPDADVIRGTIDRVNDEIRDINETEDAIRQMAQEEFEDWFYNSKFKNVFPNIANAVHVSTERLLSAPRTYENDTSIVTDNQTAENIVRQDMAAQMKELLDELKTRKEVLNQINSTLRNRKGEVEEAVTGLLTDTENGGTIENGNPVIQANGQSLLPAPAVDSVHGEPKFTVTRKSYTHTQNGEQFDLIQPDRKLTSEEYAELKKTVRDSGGYWSKYAKGFLIPKGQFDGVQNALKEINVGITEEATENVSSSNETESTGRGETTTERIPEFVVGEPFESAGAETITAERTDIPQFEVAGNTDIVPGTETGIRSETEPTASGTDQTGVTETETGKETTAPRVPDETTGANVTQTPSKNTQVSPAKEPKKEDEDLSMFEEEDRPKRLGMNVGEDGVSEEWREQVEEISKELPNIDGRFISGALDELMYYAEQTVPKRPDGKYNFETPAYTKGLPKAAERISRNMIDSADTIKVPNEKYQEIKAARDFLRNQKIHYDRAKMVSELGDERSFIQWRNAMRGRLNLTQDMSQGRGADQVFQEFAEKFPGYVDLTVWNELDQLKQLAQAADQLYNVERLKNVEENLYDAPLIYDDAIRRGAFALYNAVTDKMTGKTKPVNVQSDEEEKPAAKWTPDSKEKLTANNFPYELGTMVDHTSVATGQNVREFLVHHDDNGVVIGTDGKYKTVKYEDFERLIRNGYYRIYDPVSDNVTNHFVNEYRNQQKETESTVQKPADREPVAPTPKKKASDDIKNETSTEEKPKTGTTEEPKKRTTAAKETETEESAEDTKPYTKIADWVAGRLGRELSIDKKDLTVVANDAYGGTMGQGAYSVKDMNDALELGVNKYIIKDVSENLDEYVGNARTAIGALRDINEFLLNKIPTQTNRTEEQIAMQQFSTPPNIAYIANWVANIDGNDTVLEPSAGIGGLASFAKGMGAKTVVNELSERRLSLLKTLPFDGFYHENAEQIDNILPDSVKPTVVVMNPPFSANGRTKNKTANAIPHIEQALERLEDGGRLVAILGGGRDEGGGMSDSAPSFKAWWNELRDDYSIRANIGIDGSNYKKYGTSFNVRLVVIDKTGAQEEPTLTGEYKDLAEAIEDLEEIRNDRQHNSVHASTGDESNGTVSGGKTPSDTRKPSGKSPSGSRPVSGKRPSDSNQGSASSGNGENETVSSDERAGNSGGVDTARPEVEVSSINNGRGSDGGGRRGVDAGDVGSGTGEQSGGVESEQTGRGSSGESGDMVQSGRGATGTSVSGEVNPDEKPESFSEPEENKKRPDAEAQSIAVYAEYEPAKLPFKKVVHHPAKLVESSAMAAVKSPPLTYKPDLPANLVESGAWSDAQIETISYSGQAHSIILPDGTRKGFFVGDGTGVGKGREISGIIIDGFAHVKGKKRAVWVSEKWKLLNDARRDWSDVGRSPDEIVDFRTARNSKKGFPDEGVVYITYDTLKSKPQKKDKKDNLTLIEEWGGKDLIIVFDEAHNMGGLYKPTGKGKIGTAKAIAGNQLQTDLPNASVTYLSATGATNVENLAYASRLGLWGKGTAFDTGSDFFYAIGGSGISAMELVARDMKAEGAYIARNISYEDVRYDKLMHNLEPYQVDMYNRWCDAWQTVLKNIDRAMQLTGSENVQRVRQRKAQVFSNLQNFYSQTIASMSVPSVIQNIEKELAAGHSCVIQLTNTQEAILDKELQKRHQQGNTDDDDFDDLDLTPRDLLVGYVENAFPIEEYVEVIDESGKKSYVMVTDSEGKPVINKKALKLKEQLLEDLKDIAIPEGPLDMIINHFGVDKVAEITGRSKRVVSTRDKNGNTKKVKLDRNPQKDNEAETKAFQNGDKRILIFSTAGSTGSSYHADRRAKNQQQRIHYILQAGWRAEIVMQGLGRTNRSNQDSAPIYRLVTTDIPGQARFITTIANRLNSMGALTKGDSKAGSGVFSDGDDLETKESKIALEKFYQQLLRQPDGIKVIEDMGLLDKFVDKEGTVNIDPDESQNMTRFLNRLLVLRMNVQEKLMNDYKHIQEDIIQKAIAAGTLDRGVVSVKADKVDIETQQTVYTDPQTGAETQYLKATVYNKPEVIADLEKAKKKWNDFIGLYRTKDGSVKAVYRALDETDPDNGKVYKRFYLIGPNQNQKSLYREKTLTESCEKIPKDEWEEAWKDEVKRVPEYMEEELYMITGAILPVWKKVSGGSGMRIKAKRLTDTNSGKTYLGVEISPESVNQVLKSFNLQEEAIKKTPEEVRNLILEQGKVVTFNSIRHGVISLYKKRVNGEFRMEIMGANSYSFPSTYNGLIVESVGGFKKRYFVPDNTTGLHILQALIDGGIRAIEKDETTGNRYSAGTSNGRWGKGNHDKNAQIMSVSDLWDEAQRLFGIPINTGHMGSVRREVNGVYKEFPKTIRTRQYGDLPTLSHEIGHWFDDKYDMSDDSPYINSLIAAYKEDLEARDYSDTEIPGECVAEYFREYMQDREATEKKFRQFTNWMYGTINPTDTKKLLKFSEDSNNYHAADLERRADAQVHYRTDEDTILGNAQVVAEYLKEDPDGYLGGKGRDFMRAWFDDIHDLRGIGRSYDLAFLAKRANGIAAARLKYHMTNLNGDIVGPSLATILADAGIKNKTIRKEFDKYLIARRALDHFMANKLGENLPTLVYADEELNDPDVLMDRIRRYDDMYPSFRSASEQLYALQNQMLDLAIEAGIMPTKGDMTMEDMKQRLNELYPHYVPLYRKMDDPQAKAVTGSKYGSNNSPIAHFKGSGRDIYSPIENIIVNMAKYTSLSLVAQVKRNIYNFVTQNEGMGMIAEEVPASKILDRVSTDEIKKKLDALGKDVEALSYLSEDAKKDVLDTITEVIGDTTGQWKIKTKQGTNIMPVMVDGKVHYLEIHDEGLMKTLENLEPKQFNLLTRFMGSFTRFKKRWATGVNAKFAATNVARDLNTGFVSSSTTNNPLKYGANFIKEFVSTLLEDERFQYFQLQGGGYMGAFTHDYDLLRKLDKEIMDNAPNIKKVFRAITGIMMKLIESGENASRQAEFYRAVAQGFDNLDAFRMSQEVTVNFDRGGSYVKGINQYIPYRQAAFNALYHTADLFASGGRGGRGGNGGGNNTNDSVSRNRRNAITKWIMLGIASALLTALLSYLIGNKIKGESKEKILEEREKLSKYRKMNYWNIYIGDGKFFEIRKETMLNAPLNTIERLVDYYVLDQGDALDGLAEDLVDDILPVDILHPINDIVGGTSGLGTIYNLARNKDFKDTPIEPEWMSRQNIPLRDRYSDTTGEVWKKFGEILNQSPIKMQYAFEDNFAFWGKTFDRWNSQSGDVWAGFNNSFIADNVYSTDIINAFYNQKEKYDSPKKGEDDLETDYGSWKYQQIAGMYSDLNKFYKNESDSDYARMMRNTTNNLILQVNRDGMTDLDRAVIDTIRGNTTEIQDVCPYITPPDHYTEQKVQFDMGFEDKVTYYLQEQEMFKEGYAQIMQSGYDNATTSAMLVAYHKEVKKQLEAYWKALLIDRATNKQ